VIDYSIMNEILLLKNHTNLLHSLCGGKGHSKKLFLVKGISYLQIRLLLMKIIYPKMN